MQISCLWLYEKFDLSSRERFADDFYSIRCEYEKFAVDSFMMYDSSLAELSAYCVTSDWKM